MCLAALPNPTMLADIGNFALQMARHRWVTKRTMFAPPYTDRLIVQNSRGEVSVS